MCCRYYLNNFEDGHKQDALDLVTGGYRIASGARPSPPPCRWEQPAAAA